MRSATTTFKYYFCGITPELPIDFTKLRSSSPYPNHRSHDADKRVRYVLLTGQDLVTIFYVARAK